ncbi:unnamed protein product, partial [Trichobilharzia regenti]
MLAVALESAASNFECRAGYACYEDPHMICPNVVYRPRMSKVIFVSLILIFQCVLVGNDIENFESVRHSLKSPYMDSLVTNLDVQEQVLNHTFEKLNVREPLSNPVVINEPLCNPELSEIMFETYRVPKLLYYVDCLASFYNYQQSHSPDQTTNCLVVSFGYQTTHIVPIMPALSEKNISSGFRPLIQAARRLQVGGAHASWMLQRLLQLKYPCHSDSISGGLSE